MIEVIFGSVAIVSLTVLMAIIKVNKNKCNMCHYNCENCREQDVCCIKKEGKNERNL
ncbi:TPA: hypothetical protein N2D04_002511 [Clostridium botulinum]|nr:hypothetical protein [Clostridium botulinum]HCL4458397.1 hypothetical protein [Clostridium botulinum]HCL4462309.1 hypothetical protein [Clostridium botulinum]HCL4473368.1 hypothetical protein [Clostridium botulinum]HCL4476959.1 hypothetical protein [Clostridium botulinum]